jgi:hypothetical protein
MDALPDWPPGTAAILSTAGGAPHAIPVSTAQRAGDRTILFALARRRASLERLRADPRCALTILAAPDLGFTAHGRAAVVEDPMAAAGRVTALRLDVESIQDHTHPTFTIEAGVRWRWADPDAEAADAEVRAALAALAR